MNRATDRAARDIVVERLDAAAFAPFGEVIGLREAPDATINRGRCGRHHDLARLDFTGGGRAGISLFDAAPCALPLTLDLVERHPFGSQAFLPMSDAPFLVIAAEDEGGRPGRPRAWITDGRQGVNYRRGTWHGVLTPLARPALFAVVDRIGGEGENLEEATLDPPWRVVDAHGFVPRGLAAAGPGAEGLAFEGLAPEDRTDGGIAS